MFKKGLYTIVSNQPLTKTIYKMVLQGDTCYITAPGQFVEIEIPNKFLRRPISVCDYDKDSITLIYKVIREGTSFMSILLPNNTLDLLTGLGNGFNTDIPQKQPLLIGGGVGIPPLFSLAKQLTINKIQPTIIMGFNYADEIFYRKEFESLGCNVLISTLDGSVGTKGYVTDVIQNNQLTYDYFYACGPLPMLKVLCHTLPTEGQLSLEERMGCGFGACVGCSIETKSGMKRVCKEGPVFLKSDLKL
ncbi:MAG: dihydroorotate dehydrogenase electron transfer subunit [Sphingobacteriia bacterium]|nr:dihydroorotate dehydrogenase electron transfer subunit [Sphingobacteriia bacterium]